MRMTRIVFLVIFRVGIVRAMLFIIEKFEKRLRGGDIM